MIATPIQLIALDLDGTLLDDRGEVTERNEQAVKTAVSQGILVILATGKTRGSAEKILAQLGLQTPGVFTQGMVIHNGDGSVRYETTLDQETAVKAITFAVEQGLPHHAYCGARILTPVDNPYRHLLKEKYHEPLPEVVGPLLPQIATLRINKFLVSDEMHNDATRRRLSNLLGDRAAVTQAVPGYIEVLPPGASKGLGVQRLLGDLGISPAAMLAIGDGENDLEMLQMAGVSVAMGNGKPEVKAVAHHVTADNNHSGVALAIEKFALRQ